MWQTLTEPPEEAAGKADGKEQPDLVKALLGSRQETSLQQLLEKFLAAEGGHCSPPQMDGQMDRPAKVGTQRRDVHGADHTQGMDSSTQISVSDCPTHVETWYWGAGGGCECQVHQTEPPTVYMECPGCTHRAHDLWEMKELCLLYAVTSRGPMVIEWCTF